MCVVFGLLLKYVSFMFVIYNLNSKILQNIDILMSLEVFLIDIKTCMYDVDALFGKLNSMKTSLKSLRLQKLLD